MVLVAIAGTMLGAVVTAKAMFVSTHDLKALFVILVGAGTVAVLAALHLGEEVDPPPARSATSPAASVLTMPDVRRSRPRRQKS